MVHALGYILGPEIKVFKYSHLRQTPEDTEAMGEFIEDSYGIIFKGNGAATFGTNVIDACVRAMFFEESAGIQYKASLIGEPATMSIEEMNRRNDLYWSMAEYDVYGRAWEFYTSRVT